MKPQGARELEAQRAHLSLSLLGPFQARLGHEPVAELRMRKEQALLAYLAVESDRPHRREALAELFWPERPEGVARAGLRQALSDVRRAIGGEYLQTTRLTVQFNAATDHWLDLELYRAQLAAVRAHPHDDPDTCPLCMGRLQQIVALYRGPFLADLELDDSRAFQEWVTLHREWLFRQQGEALRRLTDYRLALGELPRARRYARRWVELDPWSERAHRQWMEVLARSGQRRAAMEQFETCRRILADELGLEPRPETVALYEQIREGKIRPPAAHPPPPLLHNLPAHLTPFVGREPELGQVEQLLSRPECRLLTVAGPGGVGKTRLALRAGEEIYGADTFAEGVWFVPLEDVASPALLPLTVAQVLGLTPKPQQRPETQLLDYLKPRTMLLLLDNFEHLMHPGARPTTGGTDRGGEEADQGPVEGIDLLLAILKEAPAVKILVTSRERLNCQAEFLLDLEGLPYPVEDLTGLTDLSGLGLDKPAVQLFLERASRLRPGIAASADTAPSIVRICQLVEGLPLGIELAAANLGPPPGGGKEARTCGEVAEAIQGGLDALSSSLHDLSARQRTIRAVFEDSWRLMTERERQTYRRLSVFRGGFGPEAARAVAGEDGEASQREGSDRGLPLQALVDRSLVRREGEERYSLHPLLRQYAAEKLAERPAEDETTQSRHGRFYLTFLRDREEAMAGERGEEALDQIQKEMGNVRAAWHWAAAQGRVGEIGASMQSLDRFYQRTSQLRQGETAFGDAADQLLAFAPQDGETQRVTGRLRLNQANCLLHRGRYAQSLQAAQAAIELAHKAQDVVGEAYGTFYWGAALWRQGEFEAARTQLERARSLARAARDSATPEERYTATSVEGRCLNLLAAVCWNQGRFAEARSYLEVMLPLFTELGDQTSKAAALGNLGVLAGGQGDYIEAKTRYEQGLRIHQEVGHPLGQSTGFVNLGSLYLTLGDYAEAETHLQQALRINREIRARDREALVLVFLAHLAHDRGGDEAAGEYSRQALALAQEVDDRDRQGRAWMTLGHALLGLGQLAEATEAYHESVALRRELDQPNLAAESVAGLARVALARADPEQARAHIEEILGHMASGGTLDGTVSPFEVYLTCYRVLAANQDPRAEELLDTAHELLQEQARKITDEKMRDSFLENVAAHRELVQAFERMSESQLT
jgi:predicted ATPase/DNA-binding SARP family transcriptional activator/Flp pilus assembly protein TadD